MIVTGANSGLGFECAGHIAGRSQEYCVVLACRNMEKAAAAKAELTQRTGNPYVLAMELDVSSLASVRRFVTRGHALNLPPLHGLVCNAGIVGMNTDRTSEGFDTVFATNHLGHFLLTNLLLPFMTASGRITVVSSDMHNPPGGLSTWPGVELLAHPEGEAAASRARYSYSKLCNLYFTYELSRRLARAGSTIAVNAFNPGLMTDTNFAPDKSRFTPEFLARVSDRLGSLEKSSTALAAIMTEPNFAGITGKYFDRGTTQTESSPLSYNEENARELWDMSAAYVGLMEGSV